MESSEQKNLTFDDLNDYCLREIFNNLSINEQFIFLGLNLKCCRIFLEHFKGCIIPEHINCHSEYVLFEIFKKTGNYFKTINLKRSVDLRLVSENCKNLEEIIFCADENNDPEVLKLAKTVKNLVKLTIYTDSRNNNCIEYFSKIPTINYIQLNNLNSTNCLRNFKNLKVLILSNCCNVKPEYFKELCENCNLKALDIRACSLSSNENLKILANYCKSMEYLAIDTLYSSTKCYNKSEILPKFDSLKYLFCLNPEDVDFPINLESLHIYSQYWEAEPLQHFFKTFENMDNLKCITFCGAYSTCNIDWKNIKFPKFLQTIVIEAPPFLLKKDNFFEFIRDSGYQFEIVYHQDMKSEIAQNFASRLNKITSERRNAKNINIFENMEKYCEPFVMTTLPNYEFESFFKMRMELGY